MASRSISGPHAVTYRTCRCSFDAVHLIGSLPEVFNSFTGDEMFEMVLSRPMIFLVIKDPNIHCRVQFLEIQNVMSASYRAVCNQFVGLADFREVYK